MRALDRLLRRRFRTEPDRVWLTRSAKLRGIHAEAQRRSTMSHVVMLAHFPATLSELESFLSDRIAYEKADTETALSARLMSPTSGSVCLALVRHLAPHVVAPPTGSRGAAAVAFLVAERHPLRERDEAIVAAARVLPWWTRVGFFISLEDSLLTQSGAERVASLLTKLGMGKEEEIDHSMVSRAIAGAQEKIKRASWSDLDAESPEDWLRINLPP